MRKSTVVFLVSFLWLSIGKGSVLADGMLLPLPEAQSPDYLAVRYHHVNVRIKDGHAVTRVEQEFFNPHDIPVDAHYLFPVPPDAILSDFEAVVDGQRRPVTRQDADTTKAELYQMVTQQQDPALLQYAGWESLAFDLNLPPGGSRQMHLEYEEVLTPSGGLYSYRYVLSTERYTSVPLEEVSVTIDIDAVAGLANLYSSSHEITVERLGASRARVTWQDEHVTPVEDFYLFYAPAQGGFGGGLLTGEREDQDHFLFLFSPDMETGPGDSLPKDIVFVIDRSGSMDGEKLRQAQAALHDILGRLGTDDRFTIVGFDDQPTVFEYDLQPVEAGTLREARGYVDHLFADGATDLESALSTALEVLLGSQSRGAVRTVVLLTDGLPTEGITDEVLISKSVAETNAEVEARIHMFGVGYDVNTHLLDQLATDNGGSVTYVRPGQNLELALTEFYGKIAHPLLTDLEIEFEGLETSDLYPGILPDMFEGSSMLLVGRYRSESTAENVRVRVSGWAGKERREYAYSFSLEEAGEHDFVPRLWATRRVGALLDRVRVEGESSSLEDEIRELGLSYGIVTPYTTFVIAGQADGVASNAAMELYDLQDLNEASGRVTIEARVQNQMYQEAAQASLAMGANVDNYGERSLAQVGRLQVDLALLQELAHPADSITGEWIERNVEADYTVEFGSEEYFALAEKPEIRQFLLGSPNVVFSYRGEVIAVRERGFQGNEDEALGSPQDEQMPRPDSGHMKPPSPGLGARLAAGLMSIFVWLVPVFSAAVLLGGFTVAAIVYYVSVR